MKSEAGQATLEYILLIAVIVMAFLLVANGISKMGIASQLSKPLQQDYARSYQYGHPKAKGFEDGGPEYHPRAVVDGKTRIFINPSVSNSGDAD